MRDTYSIFQQTGNKNVSNTTVETTLFGTGVGRKSVLANEFSVGDVLRLKLSGFFSRQNGTITIRFKIGSTTVAVSPTVSSGAGTNSGFVIDLICTCRSIGAAGTVIAQGKYLNKNASVNIEMVNLTTTVINTTIDNTIDTTIQFSTADVNNSFTVTNSYIEFVN